MPRGVPKAGKRAVKKAAVSAEKTIVKKTRQPKINATEQVQDLIETLQYQVAVSSIVLNHLTAMEQDLGSVDVQYSGKSIGKDIFDKVYKCANECLLTMTKQTFNRQIETSKSILMPPTPVVEA